MSNYLKSLEIKISQLYKHLILLIKKLPVQFTLMKGAYIVYLNLMRKDAKMKLKAIKIGKTKNGLKLALCKNSVWVRKENYKLGKIRHTWAYLVEDVPFEEAEKVFNRRNVNQ